MKNFRRALLLTLLLGVGLPCRAQEAATKYRGKVVSVENGNTLTLSVDDKQLRARLVGVDAPIQGFGEESRKSLTKLVAGKTVTFAAVPLRLNTGRQLLHVGQLFLDDTDVAISQIESGMAWQFNEHEKYQAPQDRQAYTEAERRAQKAGRGVWGKSYIDCVGPSFKTSVWPGKTTNDAGEVKRAKVSGTVIVAVKIDEAGNVIAASARCGHPILQNAALRAAYESKFREASSEITGNIFYNFMPE
ncbi:MAG TPA: thermonuclease family protein [Pyrinomonadaceae bacterium]|nr:thermonuclease family protein [Pyrinomonadaceae bacterium]